MVECLRTLEEGLRVEFTRKACAYIHGPEKRFSRCWVCALGGTSSNYFWSHSEAPSWQGEEIDLVQAVWGN